MTSWQQYTHAKIIDPQHLPARVSRWREAGQTIATVNGTFDLLHTGHVYMLHEASQTADVLIVALNSDASVRAYKHPSRPIVPLLSRMQVVAALASVGYVTWFHELDPRAILAVIGPDVHVNGAEYGETCIEAEIVKERGGRIHLVERIPGWATSEIIQTIQELREDACV